MKKLEWETMKSGTEAALGLETMESGAEPEVKTMESEAETEVKVTESGVEAELESEAVDTQPEV